MRKHSWVLAAGLALVATTLVAPAASATLTNTFYGTLDSTGATAQSFLSSSFTIVDTSLITATLTWDNSAASVSMQLKDPSGTQVASHIATTGGSEQLTFDPAGTGTGKYVLGVKAVSGGVLNFTLVVTHSVSATPPPPALASYTSTFGYPGSAGLYAYGMAFDPTDNSVLVGDYWNYRVQRFTSAGALVSIMADKTPTENPASGAPYGLAVDPTDIPSSGPTAGLSNYWVAQQEQARIVEFDHNGNWLQTVGLGGGGTGGSYPGHSYPKGCGNGAMTFPTHIAIDNNPSDATYTDIYVSDVSCKNSVYVFSHTGTYLFTFNWSGYTAATHIFQATPRGIRFGADGNVYVAELNGKAIAVFTPSGQYVRSWQVPDHGTYGSGLDDVRGIDMDNAAGVMYVVAAYYGCIFEFTQSSGALVHKWCTTQGTSGGPAFDSIRYIAADNSGNIYVGDTFGNPDPLENPTADPGYEVYKFTPGSLTTDPVTPASWATGPQPPPNGGYNNNNGVSVVTDSTNNSSLGALFVTDQFEQRVQKFDGTTHCLSVGNCPAFLLSLGSHVAPGLNSPGFDYPKAIAYGDGYVWIGDQDGNAVLAYNPDTGVFVHRFGQHGKLPGEFSGGVQGLAVANGDVFAVDTGNCRLSVFDEATALSQATPVPLTYMGGCGTGANQMAAPRGLAVSADGSTAYVVNTNTATISVWNVAKASATLLAPVCSGKKMKLPVGAAFDPTHTWLYVADGGNARVVRMAPDGSNCVTVSTGSDTPQLVFKSPQYVAFNASGDLFVSDKGRYVYEFAING